MAITIIRSYGDCLDRFRPIELDTGLLCPRGIRCNVGKAIMFRVVIRILVLFLCSFLNLSTIEFITGFHTTCYFQRKNSLIIIRTSSTHLGVMNLSLYLLTSSAW
jgi:hypothetical protein